LKNIYYTIGQVSSLLDLPQSVLRYWETVFDSLSPAKSPGGSRQYSEEDIQLIKTIKSLLYEQGFTIKGAAVKLKDSDDNIETGSDTSSIGIKDVSERNRLINELKEIIRILES